MDVFAPAASRSDLQRLTKWAAYPFGLFLERLFNLYSYIVAYSSSQSKSLSPKSSFII